MAGQNRGQTPDIKKKLLEETPRFSFIQALRLLRYISQSESGEVLDEQEINRRIHVRPDLTLEFPETDINVVEEVSVEPFRYLVTATFLGLYGTSSPLPTFYTEDLFTEQSEDVTITRDFFDIINTPLYRLFFKCWSKYRLYYKIVEQFDPDTLQRLYCLLGLEDDKLKAHFENPQSLLRYTGLTTLFPRSAEGLRALLSDSLAEPSIKIIQCVQRITEIPVDQRFILGVRGNRLGENAYLGIEIDDRMGKFRVRAGPVDSDTFHRFLPDKPAYQKMKENIRFYLDQPLLWDFELSINSDNIKTGRPGHKRWSQLGWNTWIFSEKFSEGDISVTLSAPGKC